MQRACASVAAADSRVLRSLKCVRRLHDIAMEVRAAVAALQFPGSRTTAKAYARGCRQPASPSLLTRHQARVLSRSRSCKVRRPALLCVPPAHGADSPTGPAGERRAASAQASTTVRRHETLSSHVEEA